MRLRVLPSAIGDLRAGGSFYSEHGGEVGDYFLDSLFADIDSLTVYAGVHMRTPCSIASLSATCVCGKSSNHRLGMLRLMLSR